MEILALESNKPATHLFLTKNQLILMNTQIIRQVDP